ncbi:EscU/YscU/HrcU family type III secretion system export apparatus switch protein [Paenibacillus pasadenensis]|uniref:EscU/YscU/HrcU family type III secretion system export apparatus switch protein n=1 Tax=Paenibacillus pasadenensis TaxID=217090 RepID=UPI00203DCD83|nr:EscU/YscU/HrcU family type III secretion system export apparatus switch protein [Paenibacillus pasadenensis]MCM3746027.1 EscU/YscU/HrcU family type III secretion system export apparatus switch protein [Paenibacillus pasadenensis]
MSGNEQTYGKIEGQRDLKPAGEKAEPPRKAVALKYNPVDGAPTVTAKGKGNLAEEIVQRARENGVPVQEDRSLVEVLSKLDLDQQIPPELYELVAEVLSFIYRTDREARSFQDEAGTNAHQQGRL